MPADALVLRGLRGVGATAFAFAVTFEVVFLVIPILGIIIPNMGSVKLADPGGFRSRRTLKTVAPDSVARLIYGPAPADAASMANSAR